MRGVLANGLKQFHFTSRGIIRTVFCRYSSSSPFSTRHWNSRGKHVILRPSTRDFKTSAGLLAKSNKILPVALLSPREQTSSSVKILLVPLNLKNSDEEFAKQTMSIFKILQENAGKIETFTESIEPKAPSDAAISKGEGGIWQDINAQEQSGKDKLFALSDGSEHAVAKQEVNRIQPKKCFDTEEWSEYKNEILADVPEHIQKHLSQSAISSMNLAFEMDMTNIKDALLVRNKVLTGENASGAGSEELDNRCPKDSKLGFDASVGKPESGRIDLVPLHFSAMIKGTVEVDSSKFSKDELKEIKVPQFNDYVAAIAANICGAALQKGFPYDSNRMFSTNSGSEGKPEVSKRRPSPHVVCVRQGDKGCVSPGNAHLPMYGAQSSEAPKMPVSSEGSEPSAMPSAHIGRLMGCEIYAKALQEAARLRAANSSDKDCPPKKSKWSCEPVKACQSEAAKPAAAVQCGASQAKPSPCRSTEKPPPPPPKPAASKCETSAKPSTSDSGAKIVTCQTLMQDQGSKADCSAKDAKPKCDTPKPKSDCSSKTETAKFEVPKTTCESAKPKCGTPEPKSSSCGQKPQSDESKKCESSSKPKSDPCSGTKSESQKQSSCGSSAQQASSCGSKKETTEKKCVVKKKEAKCGSKDDSKKQPSPCGSKNDAKKSSPCASQKEKPKCEKSEKKADSGSTVCPHGGSKPQKPTKPNCSKSSTDKKPSDGCDKKNFSTTSLVKSAVSNGAACRSFCTCTIATLRSKIGFGSLGSIRYKSMKNDKERAKCTAIQEMKIPKKRKNITREDGRNCFLDQYGNEACGDKVGKCNFEGSSCFQKEKPKECWENNNNKKKGTKK